MQRFGALCSNVVVLVFLAMGLTACGSPPMAPADFSGTWRGQATEHDLCSYDCDTVRGPYDVVIHITQDGADLVVDYDGQCTYEATAGANGFAGVERDRGDGQYDCADWDADPLPVAAELVGGVLRGRAYFETAGDTYCMLEFGCYAQFEVTRDD